MGDCEKLCKNFATRPRTLLGFAAILAGVDADGWDANGKPLLTYTKAGAYLGTTRDEIETLVEKGALLAGTPAERAAPRAGRPPSKYVHGEAVEALREERLRALGACDASVERERDDLRAELAALQARVADAEIDDFGIELAELRNALARERDRSARLHAAVEAGVAAQRAQLDQIRNLLLPSGVWDDPGLATHPSA